jgi:hypothetical protein
MQFLELVKKFAPLGVLSIGNELFLLPPCFPFISLLNRFKVVGIFPLRLSNRGVMFGPGMIAVKPRLIFVF